MTSKLFRVGRSKTGLGLFATAVIAKGTLIAQYRGRRLRNEEADKLADRGAKYLYELNSRWTIDGSNRRNLARYGNHSCRPNAESDVTRKGKIIIRARKKILPGDEITYDYGKDYFDLIIKPLGCKCDKCLSKSNGQDKTVSKKAKKVTKAKTAKTTAKKAKKTSAKKATAKKSTAKKAAKKATKKKVAKKRGAKKA